jgi:hypothetical protein
MPHVIKAVSPVQSEVICCEEAVKEYLGAIDAMPCSPGSATCCRPDNQVLPLGVIAPSPWDALKVLEIDFEFIESGYTCLYTGYTFFGVIPVALCSEDLSKYNEITKRFNDQKYWLDYEFHRLIDGEKRFALTDIQKLLLGSGYTYGFSWYDGTPALQETKINLSNGDYLWAWFWEWYNK